MQFLDDSLLPENQQKLVITVAPYGPEWEISDFPEDLPLTMEEQAQKAVDCYNAGATVLHLHVREMDGKGSKRLSKFNELLGMIRARVPDMILQVGGSISFAPEGEGEEAKWLSDDTRHMLAELTPKPDQVTIAVNTSQFHRAGGISSRWAARKRGRKCWSDLNSCEEQQMLSLSSFTLGSSLNRLVYTASHVVGRIGDSASESGTKCSHVCVTRWRRDSPSSVATHR